MLNEVLVESFGRDWFRSDRCGKLLDRLWSRGESIECEELASELGYERWDTGPLTRRFKRLLDA